MTERYSFEEPPPSDVSSTSPPRSTSETDSVGYKRQRAFNSLNESYFLPLSSDEDEWVRLDQQHAAVSVGLGLYPAPDVVRAILSPPHGKKVLDLGFGTGVWSIDMAREFPDAEIIGIDLAPCPVEPDQIPPNCRFEVEDINLGLNQFRDQFDVIHARGISAGVTNAQKTIDDVIQCLKPGGIVLWLQPEYDFYSGKQGPSKYLPFASDSCPDGSHFSRMIYETGKAAATTGKSDIIGISNALTNGFWEHPLMDPESCKTGSLFLPIGPWASGSSLYQTEQLKYIGSLLRQDSLNAHRAFHAVLKKGMWSEETIDEWSRRADEELLMNKHDIWGRIMLAWGRRRAAKGQPAPPLPELSVAVNGNSTDKFYPSLPPYPHCYIYDSKEQSLREAEIRNRDKTYLTSTGPS